MYICECEFCHIFARLIRPKDTTSWHKSKEPIAISPYYLTVWDLIADKLIFFLNITTKRLRLKKKGLMFA